MGELIVWIVFPTVTICMYRSSPLVPLGSCLTAAACLSSACSFAVSQASDLALLVGYAAWEDFNFSKARVFFLILLDDHRYLVEPSCGAALAAGYSGIVKDLIAKGEMKSPVVFIVCGGSGVSQRLLNGWKQETGLTGDVKWCCDMCCTLPVTNLLPVERNFYHLLNKRQCYQNFLWCYLLLCLE